MRGPIRRLQNGRRATVCELRYHGEYGVEAQFLEDAQLSHSRRFDTRAMAVQWAEQEREALQDDGWA